MDQIVSKPLVRTQKALLYSLYKQRELLPISGVRNTNSTSPRIP